MAGIVEGWFEFADGRGRMQRMPLLSSGQESGHLAIVLPGRNYGPDKPVLYYPSRLMLAHGADVLQVDYGISREESESQNLGEQAERAASVSDLTIRAVLEQIRPEWITLIGKSLGAFVMIKLLTSNIPLPRTDCIWITPVLKQAQLAEQMEKVRQISFVAAGGSDPYSDEKALERLEKISGMHTLVIEKADHSLEIPGNINESLRGLQRLLRGIEGFMGWRDFRAQWGWT
ncbi:hypothetical protein EHM76_01435 [bacterium]|nr:MAG: hypothetical protein EHM76_01435 [bacterium]